MSQARPPFAYCYRLRICQSVKKAQRRRICSWPNGGNGKAPSGGPGGPHKRTFRLFAGRHLAYDDHLVGVAKNNKRIAGRGLNEKRPIGIADKPHPAAPSAMLRAAITIAIAVFGLGFRLCGYAGGTFASAVGRTCLLAEVISIPVKASFSS